MTNSKEDGIIIDLIS